MNQATKNLALWLVLGLMFLLLFNVFTRQQGQEPEIIFSDFWSAVDRGDVQEVTIQGQHVHGKYQSGERFRTFSPSDPDMVKTLREKNIRIAAKPEDDSPWYFVLLVNWFPMLLLVGVWVFFMRQMQAGGGKAMSFGKSRARLLNENQTKVTFSDVAGVDEAKEELQEVIAFLKDPKKFTRLGGRIPKGCLLVGPPGTGKTLLARAIAGEAGVPFFSISGVGVSWKCSWAWAPRGCGICSSRPRNKRRVSSSSTRSTPSDASAAAGLGGGHDEREQTLNQLLVEMDGFEANDGVILIAATNRPDVLDPALLRPGRFDRRVVVPRPDIKGREGILQVHSRRVPLESDVDIRVLARGTSGICRSGSREPGQRGGAPCGAE